jgi:DNA-binding NtrC family response regulator
MPSALIVDDDPRTAVLLANVFENRGFATRCANSLAEARGSLDPTPDICLVEMRLPDGNGMELLADGLAGRTDVVMLTGCETAESSVEALRRGARDYLTKPLSRDAIDRILARFDNGADHGEARPAPSEIVGESPEMKRVLQALARIGRSEATVLIIGESGTGKELVAARLHELSPRSQARYLTLNCGAVSPNLIESELFGHEKGSFTGATRQHAGYFERAHGGTLFLDEITEMPLELQVRLLLVLESRRVTRVGSSEAIPIDVRVIAATNRDPSAAVREGKLREDLLYRLQVVPIEVPPLRMRSGDVRLLASHFLTELNRAATASKAFSESALERLEQYSWPGNVRELYNAVQRAFIMTEGRTITHLGLPRDGLQGAPVGIGGPLTVRIGESIAEVERRLILHTVRDCRTQDEAARMLGISTKTLYNKLRQYESRNRMARELSSLPSEKSWN